ncbi:tetrahydromethanopterin S-methyltransferase subunit H [Methanosphaera sp. WGK6]|uniref:tetrahydromethanopterin S-methyltransferase subunit H n=1 Tax=Methanosphaera sp. WGK6 TaxID=1561964 RepID=UPI00084CC378|nr:tetrahydromethanopterin S-methyltransferase subunit H [Methanosphaera sp. WGK6]OED30224.1 tetrahydromethanopterin S-methyltransferase subunit H [Methanosphaera sp. WGK6]
MFKFEKKQEVFDIYGVKIGGQPGEYPTVLAGTIFYAGHNILSDENKGVFDKDKAETLLNTMDEMTDKTGNPNIVQVFGATPEALIKYIDFVSEVSDSPFLIDSTSADARIAGSEYVTEAGLAERTIYNSINMSIDDEEIDAITKSDITSSIILGFNPTQPGVDGKISLWEDGSGILDKGLLEIAEDCGIFKPLMDVAVTPLGQGGGSAIKTTLNEKSRFGYPAGSGVHNVPSSWDWIKKYKKEYPEVWPVCDVGANIIQQMAGGDFVLFGPIENTRKAFTACAMTDMFIAEANETIGVTPIDSHPYKNLL